MRRFLTASLLVSALAATGSSCETQTASDIETGQRGAQTGQRGAPHVLDDSGKGLEHVLNRIGYGPDVWSIDRIGELRVRAYIDEQLHPDWIDDSDFEARIADLSAVQMSWRELQESYCATCPLGTLTAARRELTEAKILRSIYSRRQLEAVLVDFWFDHFNVDASQGLLRIAAIPFERDVIRPRVFGRFEDLLIAVAQSPAMLDYLDNSRNTWAGYTADPGSAGINENYARELLELHTVGVDGGYGQADVHNVARAMTGWRLVPSLQASLEVGGDLFGTSNWTQKRYFVFVPAAHEPGPKQLMDTLQIPRSGGIDDGLEVLGFLARHPRTAERISRLLVQRFVSEDAPEWLVTEAASTFAATDGNLRAVMRTILLSPEFAEGHIREKVKRPLVLIASLVRAARVEVRVGSPLARDLARQLEALGEPLHRAAPPTGFPDASEAWASPGALIQRFRLIQRYIADGKLGARFVLKAGTSPWIVDSLIGRLVPGRLSRWSRRAVLDFLEQSDPDDPRRIPTAASLVLCSPEFMRH